MWGSHEGFLSLVQNVWSMEVEGCYMVRISRKLKALKGALRKWSLEVFGQVDKEIKAIEDSIVRLEQAVSNDFSQQSENE